MTSDPWTTEKYQACLNDIGLLLSRLVPTVTQYERALFRRLGFTATQGNLLLLTLKNPSLTMGEAAKSLSLDVSTLTRVVAPLIRDGYLLKAPDTIDRRIWRLATSVKGQTEGKALQQEVEAFYRKLIEGLPKGHVREVMAAVETLTQTMEAALED